VTDNQISNQILTAITVRDDLREATQEARDAAQELHGVLKDVIAERKRIDAAVASIPQRVEDAVGELARRELAVLGEMTKTATDEACQRVTAVFDKFTAVLLGEDAASKRRGSPTLQELMTVRDVVDRIDTSPPPSWVGTKVIPRSARRKS
jgi:hypothetical protein